MDLKRKQTLWGAVSGGVMAITVAMVLILGGPPSLIPHRPVSAALTLRLELIAARDFGRLPARGTAAGQFCGSMGALGTPDHCWQFGGSGTVADQTADATKWDLATSGSPRIGLVTGIPVADSTGWVDWTSELAAQGIATSDFYQKTSASIPNNPKISVTIVYAASQTVPYSGQVVWLGSSPARNWSITASASNVLGITITGASATKTLQPNPYADPSLAGSGFRCCTLSVDTTAAEGSKAWCNGTDVTPASHDMTGVGDYASSGTITIGRAQSGPIARLRVDYTTATLADHKALCGSLGQVVDWTHAASADVYRIHDTAGYGQARCYPAGVGRASCVAAGRPAYRWTGTDYRWTMESGRTNRILYSGAPICGTGWTCTTATIALAASPTGLMDAGAITMGGGTVKVAGTSYTASAALHPRLWVKMSAAGVLDASHVGGEGHWTIDSTTLGSAWTEVYTGHPAVTEIQPWKATGAGAVNITFSGSNASVWMPTVTEVAGRSVIPTKNLVYAGQAQRIEINNIDGRYWQHSDTATITGDAACVDLGPTVAITGQLGAECLGDLSSLKIEGSASRIGSDVIFLAGQSNAEGIGVTATQLDATHLPLPDHWDYWIAQAQAALVRGGNFGVRTYFGSEPWWAHTFATAHPTQPAVIIKRAISGRSLYYAWYYTDDAGRRAVTGDTTAMYQYSYLVADYAAVTRGQVPRSVIMVWIQGEADTGMDVPSADYAAGLDRFITHLSADIGHQIDQLIVPRVCIAYAGGTYYGRVIAAQNSCDASAYGGADCTVIDTDSFDCGTGGAAGHYTGLVGLPQLGNAIGAAITP
jgi:hypothetical protein